MLLIAVLDKGANVGQSELYKDVMSLTILLFILYSMSTIKPGYSKNGGLLYSNTFARALGSIHEKKA